MAVTAKQVYDMALVLIDEVARSGSISPNPPKYYEQKSLSILTQLQTELLSPQQEPQFIKDINQELIVTDKIAITVLPYGLAAHLLLTDDVNTASFFNNRYDEMKKKKATKIEPIIDTLGITGGMQ